VSLEGVNMFKIILSRDHKTATLYYPLTGQALKFYDSYGTVMLMVEDFLLTPIGNN